MNVFDFDGTIYDGDSSVDFYRFCLKHYPGVLRHAPRQFFAGIQFVLGLKEKTAFKEQIYSYFLAVPEVEACVIEFWDSHEDKVKGWYKEMAEEDDVIVSASPEFLLRPICQRLGIRHLIASRVSPENGRYDGLNCHGEEKVVRFREKFPKAEPTQFYSDSLSDKPLSLLAKEKFVVRGDRLVDWETFERDEAPKLERRRTFFSVQFLRFCCVGCINGISGLVLEALWAIFLQKNLAFILGYLMSLAIGYFLNSRITFQSEMSVIRLVKYYLSYGPNFIIQNLSVILFYNLLRWPHLLAYLMAALVGAPVTFLMLKFFAFRRKHRKE